jgi:hypothetical protein
MPYNFRHLLAALAALTLLMTGTPVAGQPVRNNGDWAQPYFSYRYDNGQAFFYIPTNGDTFGAYGEIGGRQTAFTDFDPRTSEQLGQDFELEAIWKSKCPREDIQKVKLVREVYLPGAPSKLLVNIQPYVQDPAYHDNHSPFAWAEVRINGTEVARIDRTSPLSTWKTVDATAQAGSVVMGLNKIQIVAKKAETKKKWDFCWNAGRPTFGVEAEIYGELTADLSVSIPTGSGGTNEQNTTATIANLGPTEAVDGQFGFRSFDGTGGDITVIELSGAGMVCQTTDVGDGLYGTCALPDIPSGSSIVVDMHLEWTGTCPGNLNIPTSRNATSRWTDPVQTNNQSPPGAGIRCASTG